MFAPNTPPQRKCVVLMSGGLDSTALLQWILNEGYTPIALTVNYGQFHKKEIESAKRICDALKVPQEVADITSLSAYLPGTDLIGTADTKTQQPLADESRRKTVLPNRGMLFLSIATALAIREKCQFVAYAVHGDDAAACPDSRPEFAKAAGQLISLADELSIQLLRPFISNDKPGITRIGFHLGAKLENTWSCFLSGDYHCGKCQGCLARKKAFGMSGIQDVTTYANSVVVEQRGVKGELMAKPLDELKAIVTQWNSDPNNAQKLVPFKAEEVKEENREMVVNSIMKAAGYTVA